MAILVCSDCGQEFRGHNKVKRCPDCTPRADFLNKCEACGEPFYPSKFTGKRQTTCSYECSIVYMNAHRDIRKNFTYVCKYCGEEYQTAYRDRNTYCSRDCSFADPDAIWRDNLVEATITIECAHCGEEVLRVDAYNGHVCSEDCYIETYMRECPVCGDVFEAKTIESTLCGKDECRLEYGRRKYYDSFESAACPTPYTCVECGESGVAPTAAGRKYCLRCAKIVSNRNSAKGNHQQRAKRYGAAYRWFSDVGILKRDGWRCYLCGCDTPEELRGTYEDNAPELDHVVPLSRGGTHTKDNVRCACRACNILKGAMSQDEFVAEYVDGC